MRHDNGKEIDRFRNNHPTKDGLVRYCISEYGEKPQGKEQQMSSDNGSDNCKFEGDTPTGSGFNGGGTAGGSGTYPKSPFSSPTNMPVFIPDPSLRGQSFDQLLQNRGVRFLHRLSAPCPNLRSLHDNSHDPNCSVCDGNGMMYYREKEIYGVFYSNSLEKNFEMQGIWEIGSAVVTLPTQYPDGTQADFNTFDQLVIPDFTVRLWELKEYEPRPDRRQQMRYPIKSIDYIAAVKNNVTVPYEEGTHYNIVDDKIEWVASQEPDYDSINERGEVYVVVYFAHPVYNVLQHMRELRITQELANGSKVPVRLPQQVLVKRDFLFNKPETEASAEG